VFIGLGEFLSITYERKNRKTEKGGSFSFSRKQALTFSCPERTTRSNRPKFGSIDRLAEFSRVLRGVILGAYETFFFIDAKISVFLYFCILCAF